MSYLYNIYNILINIFKFLNTKLFNKSQLISSVIHNVEFKYNSNITSYEKLNNFKALKEWCENLNNKNGILTHGGTIGPVEILNVTYFGNNIGFIYLDAKAKINNNPIPSISLIRNKCVAVLPLFYNENNILCAAFVKQFRSPMGLLTIEMPAGICDGNTLTGQAAQELKEELNLTVKENDIKWLYENQATSPGCLNEVTSLGLVMINNFMEQLPVKKRNKINGVKEEGEFIKTKILELDYARKTITDMKFNATIGLIETKIRNGDLELSKLKLS